MEGVKQRLYVKSLSVYEHSIPAGSSVAWHVSVQQQEQQQQQQQQESDGRTSYSVIRGQLTVDVSIYWREEGRHRKGEGDVVQGTTRCAACRGEWAASGGAGGQLVFVLDNQFSWATNKNVTVTLRPLQPDQPEPEPEPERQPGPTTALAAGATADDADNSCCAMQVEELADHLDSCLMLMQDGDDDDALIYGAAATTTSTTDAGAAAAQPPPSEEAGGRAAAAAFATTDSTAAPGGAEPCQPDHPRPRPAAAATAAAERGGQEEEEEEEEEEPAETVALRRAAALLCSLGALERELAVHLPEDEGAAAWVRSWRRRYARYDEDEDL
jgi:hypothetical protein